MARWVFAIAATLAFVLYPNAASAGTIKLAWDAVGDPDLAGYHVYYGTVSGVYTQFVSAGNQTNFTLTGLQDCKIYYLALKAVDANGNESVAFSNEVTGMSAPVPSTVTELLTNTSAAKQGTANLPIRITGTNFDTQARPDFGPDVVVNSYSTTSCTQMTANITINNAARVNSAPGLPRLISVINQGGPLGEKSGIFTVKFNERRADIDGSGRVMGRDLLYWGNAFGSSTGNPNYNINADLNGDGVVDGADLSLLALWHGTQFF